MFSTKQYIKKKQNIICVGETQRILTAATTTCFVKIAFEVEKKQLFQAPPFNIIYFLNQPVL